MDIIRRHLRTTDPDGKVEEQTELQATLEPTDDAELIGLIRDLFGPPQLAVPVHIAGIHLSAEQMAEHLAEHLHPDGENHHHGLYHCGPDCGGSPLEHEPEQCPHKEG